MYARGAPINVACDDAGFVLFFKFVKMDAALGWYSLSVDPIMDYMLDVSGTISTDLHPSPLTAHPPEFSPKMGVT